MKHLLKLSFILYICTSLCICPVLAGVPGSSAANFLKIPAGPRACGMGEAFTGVCNDASSIYWNPAGLGSLTTNETSLLYTKWLDDTSYQYFLGAFPLKLKYLPQQTMGISIYSFSYGTIQGADYLGAKTNNITAKNLAIAYAYGINLHEITGINGLYSGLSVKYISETLDDLTAQAYACDIGVFQSINIAKGKLGLGLCVKNAGTALKFVSEEYPLPLNTVFGISYKKELLGLSDPFTIACDVNYPNDSELYINSGVEYWAANLIAIRCGYKSNQDTGSGLRAGLGLRMNIFQFDFSYGNYNELGATYQIGLTARFGKPYKMRITNTPPDQDEINSFMMYGNSLYNQGRYAEAMLEYIRVTELDKGNKKALEMMIKCNDKIKKQ